MIVFTEGGGSTDYHKLYVTALETRDDNEHPRWFVTNTGGRTRDNDASSPSWEQMHSGDTPTGESVKLQIRVYAGVAE